MHYMFKLIAFVMLGIGNIFNKLGSFLREKGYNMLLRKFEVEHLDKYVVEEWERQDIAAATVPQIKQGLEAQTGCFRRDDPGMHVEVLKTPSHTGRL